MLFDRLRSATILLLGIFLSYLIGLTIMWGVWGAPVHPTLYLFLCGGLGLMITELLLVFKNHKSLPALQISFILILGGFYIPLAMSFKPLPFKNILSLNNLALFAYFTVFILATTRRPRHWLKTTLFGLSLLAGLLFFLKVLSY